MSYRNGPAPEVIGGAPVQFGKLAKQLCGVDLPLQVLKSANGYYIGTWDDEGPCSRESKEYWPVALQAESALISKNWTQRDQP